MQEIADLYRGARKRGATPRELRSAIEHIEFRLLVIARDGKTDWSRGRRKARVYPGLQALHQALARGVDEESICIAQPLLFKLTHGKKSIYIKDKEELQR